VIIVDGVWSCVGSTNFDDRSFQRNDEITVGFTGRELAQKLRDAFFDDMKDAREVRFEEWRSRPWHHKVVDAAAFTFRAEL